LGLFQGERLLQRWRISSIARTTDELGLLWLQLLQRHGLNEHAISGVVVSCVVPSLMFNIDKAAREYLGVEPLLVEMGIKTGVPIRTDNPREVGADRIVNTVAALALRPGPMVVVDFGTATTFDCINAQGEYVGGVISPGVRIAADALVARTAKLPRIQLEHPGKIIGTNTVDAMKSGVFWGYVGLVDKLAAGCKAELGADVHCIATGGLASLIGPASDEIDQVIPRLTLDGLRILATMNGFVDQPVDSGVVR
jgi:type III pantothenate kinase